MTNSTCGPGAHRCARTDQLFGVDGVHVLAVTTRDDGTVVLDVELAPLLDDVRSGRADMAVGRRRPARGRRA